MPLSLDGELEYRASPAYDLSARRFIYGVNFSPYLFPTQLCTRKRQGLVARQRYESRAGIDGPVRDGEELVVSSAEGFSRVPLPKH